MLSSVCPSVHLVVSTSGVDEITTFPSVHKVIAPVRSHGVVVGKCVDLVILPSANQIVRLKRSIKAWHIAPLTTLLGTDADSERH